MEKEQLYKTTYFIENNSNIEKRKSIFEKRPDTKKANNFTIEKCLILMLAERKNR